MLAQLKAQAKALNNAASFEDATAELLVYSVSQASIWEALRPKQQEQGLDNAKMTPPY